ncbi:MAG: AmmeMemoRadiSam system protein A [Candidatus Sulfotelmatobacter sp.]
MSHSDWAHSHPASEELSLQDQSTLVRLAHDAILSALEKREISLAPPTERLAQFRGVFTSLYLNNELRGCVGYVQPENSLYRAVAESARAAAFGDTRFSPLSKEEAPHVCVQLSILSPLQSIAPEAIEIGHHGLLITRDGHRGLLLPQVAIEHGWDRTTFLEQTCRKAALPTDAWRDGAIIEAFTAQVFGDKGRNTDKK